MGYNSEHKEIIKQHEESNVDNELENNKNHFKNKVFILSLVLGIIVIAMVGVYVSSIVKDKKATNLNKFETYTLVKDGDKESYTISIDDTNIGSFSKENNAYYLRVTDDNEIRGTYKHKENEFPVTSVKSGIQITEYSNLESKKDMSMFIADVTRNVSDKDESKYRFVGEDKDKISLLHLTVNKETNEQTSVEVAEITITDNGFTFTPKENEIVKDYSQYYYIFAILDNFK